MCLASLLRTWRRSSGMAWIFDDWGFRTQNGQRLPVGWTEGPDQIDLEGEFVGVVAPNGEHSISLSIRNLRRA